MKKLLNALSIQSLTVTLVLSLAPSNIQAQNNSAGKFMSAIMLLLNDDEKVCTKNNDGPDFNGDGCADLAIGAPLAKVSPETSTNSINDAGQVNVMYGNVSGLSDANNQTWHLNGGFDSNGSYIGDIQGAAQSQDHFGEVIATGDFNNDGYSDLAVGVGEKDRGLLQDIGTVYILYGSKTGLSAANNQQLTQSGISNDPEGDGTGELIGDLRGDLRGGPEETDLFGYSLAVGDFNNDNFDDLAVGVPFEDIGSVVSAGAVHIVYGSIEGLTADGNEFWEQDSVVKHQPSTNNYVDIGEGDIQGGVETGDNFGTTLTTGDFNGDNSDDLAVGVPNEDIGNLINAGAIQVFHGAAAGLQTENNIFWQSAQASVDTDGDGDADEELGNPFGAVEAGDKLGFALAAGDINNDGADDLIAGTPFEDIDEGDGNDTKQDHGIVYVWYGAVDDSLTLDNEQQFSPIELINTNDGSKTALPGVFRRDIGFGGVVSVGDINGDNFDDVVVGTPGDIFNNTRYGSVMVLYGSGKQLTASGAQFFSPNFSRTSDGDLPGLIGEPLGQNRFGQAVSISDLDGDGFAEVVIGAPGSPVPAAVRSLGSIHVLPGSRSGAQIPNHQFWTLDGGFTGDPDNPAQIGDLWGETNDQNFGRTLQ